MSASRSFEIRISTDCEEAEHVVRAAAAKIACELDWGNDRTTSIEAVEINHPRSNPTYLAGWEMEPGQ